VLTMDTTCAACGAINPPGGLRVGHQGSGADYMWFCTDTVGCADRCARLLGRPRGQSGVTVVELLVVISILMILAGVVMFAIDSDGSNDDDRQACLDSGGRWADYPNTPALNHCIEGPDR